jgi:hypothetical protein
VLFRSAKRVKLADAETQTEPDVLLAHTETLLLGALATLRAATQASLPDAAQ